jgi:hypothetical protein
MHPTRLCSLFLAAAATAQSGTWTQLQTATVPGPRFNNVLVYDAARGVLVLYGGAAVLGGTYTDTWEYSGTDWVQRQVNGPSAGSVNGVYDSARQRTVVLVGNGPSGAETWEWDGLIWTQRTLPQSPIPRFDFGMAYDSVRARTVLFGGSNRSDTWEYDGNTWVQRSSGGPPGRSNPGMTFDSTRGVVVLFGGNAPGGALSDTWEWNGTYWLEHFGIAAPTPRGHCGFGYDPVRQRGVLYGGNSVGDTWEWDGSAWTQMTTNTHPTPTSTVVLTWDSSQQRVVVFGSVYVSETWAYAVLGGTPASFVTFGQGCSGPAGVPTLGAAAGNLPRLGTTFGMTLSNLGNTPFSLPFGVIGSSNSTWNGQPLPVDLAILGMPGCSAFIAPEVSFTLSNQGGSANWGLVIPFAPPLLGTNFYVQGAVLAPGANLGGMVVSNAGHGVVGPP